MWKPTYLEINDISPNTIYYNRDQNLYLWKKYVTPSKWSISAKLAEQLDVDGYEVVTDFRTFNDEFYYSLYGSFYLWFDSDNTPDRWVISKNIGFGTTEYWSDDDEEYKGDEWYSSNNFEGSFLARGSLRGATYGAYEGTPKVVAIKIINGWESDNLFGEYAAITDGGATGNKYVGWKRLTGDNNLGNLDQISPQLNNKYIFSGSKSLWYDGTDWILNSTPGTKDSAVGYWEGSAPPTPSSTTTVYTLVYSGDSPNPTPSSYTLTFDSYIAGNETSEALQGQLAVWLDE